MTQHQTCDWIGNSGTRYKYHINPLPVSFNPDQDGNYIYAKLNNQQQWVPIYIGEGDLADRSGSSHHQADCIRRKGATHFHCHLNASKQDRRSEEQDLLANYTNAYQPIGCNEKLGG